MNDLTARRRDTSETINEDPWDITVYRRKLPSASDETVTTGVVGRIQPTRALQDWMQNSFTLTGEAQVGKQRWTLLVAYDAYVTQSRDDIKAVQRSSGITRRFFVVYRSTFAYKQEVILDEVE